MGASESTAKTNGGKEEEDERHTDSMASAAAKVAGVAAVGVAAVGVAAWGISKMLSDNKNSQRKQNAMTSNSSRLEGRHEMPNISRLSLAPPSYSGPFKMNTDGACRPDKSSGSLPGYGVVEEGPSGCGGILRDNRGNWVRGFRGYIGVTYSVKAEFLGILKGLQLLDELGLVDSILESDCDTAVDWIMNHHRLRSEIIKDCWGIITECRCLKDENRITVNLISRNDNKCADKLASMAINNDRERYVEIMNLPYEIKDLVAAESARF